MFCQKCGAELQDNSKFCTKCGARVAGEGASADARQNGFVGDLGKASTNLFSEGMVMLRKLFSKEPLTAIAEASENKTLIGVVLMVINSLLFALISCLNTTQTMNYAIKGVMAGVRKTASMAAGFGGIFSIGEVADVKIPVVFSLFVPFLLIIVCILAAEFAAVYVILKVSKRQVDSPLPVLNVIAIAGVPIALALIINLIIGFVFPPAAIAVFVAALFIHMAFMYEGIKNLGKFELAPVWEYSIFSLALCLVVMIICVIAFNNMMNSAADLLGGYLNSEMGGLFDVFS